MLLKIEELKVKNEDIILLDNIDLEVNHGEIIGIIGESGSGKSLLAKTLLALNSKNLVTSFRSYNYEDKSYSYDEIKLLRGKHIAMIFQNPHTALDPSANVKSQLKNAMLLNNNSENIKYKSIELLNEMGIKDAERCLQLYPHQLSGGMAQRILIALMLAREPSLLIADEPTTALDPLVQEQILNLLKAIVKKRKMGLILISHDLRVIKKYADKTIVMYSSQVVEKIETQKILDHAKHPYTRELISLIPSENIKYKENLRTIKGRILAANEYVMGCRFSNRCLLVEEKCNTKVPELKDSTYRCHF